MSPRRPNAIIPLIRCFIVCFFIIATLAGASLYFTFDLVREYQLKVHNIEQIGELLASSASSPEGVDLVADQVSDLLNREPIFQSIVFYSIDHPIINQGSSSAHWREALFADTISINQAVTSRYFSAADVSRHHPNRAYVGSEVGDNTLLGYISITLDLDELRREWLAARKYVWLSILLGSVLSGYLILRLLTRALQQVVELAKISDDIIRDPHLTQMPVIQQDQELQEVSRIKEAMLLLFRRLNVMQKKHEALKDYEQQLHNKDLSLDVQRHSFQSMITHELKTSLNAIFGGLQLLDNHYLSNEQQDALMIIRKGSQQLDFTLEQIIQLNKIEKGQIGLGLVAFNPLQLISDLIAEFESLAQEKGLLLTSRITHVDYMLEGDVSKIKLILAALLDNAIKFTKSGQVTIESHLNHFDQTTRWHISVIDSGIGIETRYLDEIFTPFFQIDPSINREFEGVGVGLSLAKQMAQLIGASVEVESVPGQGSTFRVIMKLDNWDQQQNKHLLMGVKALYYHQDLDHLPSLAGELTDFGLEISTLQYTQSILETIAEEAVDLLIISEDVSSKNAENLANQVRHLESAHRTLIVYMLAATDRLEMLQPDLKAAGVDYCQPASISAKQFARQLKQWLVI